MASLDESHMALKTARAGIARAGISRANVTTINTEVEFSPAVVGKLAVHRPRTTDGDPELSGTWTVERIG